jgi:hypothetical protein
VDPNGGKSQWMIMKGWKHLVEWKDGMTDWIPLKELKGSYAVYSWSILWQTTSVCVVGTNQSTEARTDHPEGEDLVMEANS